MNIKRLYLVNLLLAILLIPASYFHSWTGVGFSLGAREMPTSDAVPLGFFFAIWWVIFIGLIWYGYTLYMLGRKETKKLAEYTGISLLLCIAWTVTAQIAGREPFWFLPLALLVAYIFAARAYLESFKVVRKLKKSLYWKVVAPLGLFAGWLGLAFFINLSVVLEATGGAFMRLREGDQAAVLIFIATIVSLYMTYRAKAELSYPLAVFWGLLGIFLSHFGMLAGDAALLSLLALVLGTAIIHYTD